MPDINSPENISIDFIDNLLKYFPQSKTDEMSGTQDAYLMDLIKTIKDNYLAGNFQVSYFYTHLVFMSFVYYCVETVIELEPNRSGDLYYPINSYAGRNDKPDINNLRSIYDFSKIPEKEIFKIFKCIGMEDEDIKALSRYISSRDDYAHATGKGNISIENFNSNSEVVIQNMLALQQLINVYLEKRFVEFLKDNFHSEYEHAVDAIKEFIFEEDFSNINLQTFTRIGFCQYRNNDETVKKNFWRIKNLFCAYLDVCEEVYWINTNDILKEYRSSDDFYFYKYLNKAEDYISEVLRISEYECVKDGGEWPLHTCINCDQEQLVHDVEQNRFLCFSCEEIFEQDDINFCCRCGDACNPCEDSAPLCYNCKKNL